MDNETQQKLAESLTADTKDIIPFLPYLLQDFWELGSSPDDMSQLVKEFIDTRVFRRFLDFGCGKGAISITLAKNFGVQVTGIDILDEFIIEARWKAQEHGVIDLTNFECGNIADTVLTSHDYDCVIYGAVSCIPSTDTLEYQKSDYEEEFAGILTRAEELSEKYPQHREMFERYAWCQRNEYDDLLGCVTGATWLLRKKAEEKKNK